MPPPGPESAPALISFGPDFLRGFVQTASIAVIAYFAKRILDLTDRTTRQEEQIVELKDRLHSTTERIQNAEERCFRVLHRLHDDPHGFSLSHHQKHEEDV